MRKVNRVDARAIRYGDLGTVVLERDGVEVPVGGPKPAVLLAMSLLHRNRRVSAGR
jgi:DNA-binding SARP family transcriptional activator